MMDWLKDWIAQIVTVTMLLIVLEVIMPSGKYRKYIGLIAGFVLIIAIVGPVVSVLKKDFDFGRIQFQDYAAIKSHEIQYTGPQFDEEQTGQMIQVYRDMVLQEITAAVNQYPEINKVEADVIMNENINSNEFGRIQRIYLNIHLQEGKKNEKVKIPEIQVGKTPADSPALGAIDEETEQSIKENLFQTFKVDKENIVISIYKS